MKYVKIDDVIELIKENACSLYVQKEINMLPTLDLDNKIKEIDEQIIYYNDMASNAHNDSYDDIAIGIKKAKSILLGTKP